MSFYKVSILKEKSRIQDFLYYDMTKKFVKKRI